MTGAVPPLRAGVVLDVTAEGTGALADPVLGRRIKLDVRGVALCSALGLGDVAAIAAAIGSSDEVVGTFVDRLVALDLCDTARARERVAERVALTRVKAEPAAHLRVLPGARFACTMCGSCCGGHNVGPVSEAILDGLDVSLEALEPVIRKARRIDKDLFVSLPPGDRATPGTHVMCHASNGSCVFLDDEGKCRIHAKLGGEAKPLPCRIFPWELVATPTGVRVSVQRECRDFLAATSDAAPPLEDAIAELSALVSAIETLPAARPIPIARGAELASWAAWEALEARMLALVEAGGRGQPASGRPSGLGEARAVLAALVACLPPGSRIEPFAAWRAALGGRLAQMLKAAPAPNERLVIRIDAAKIALAALDDARGWVLARALGPLSGDGATLFREHLRHALWATTPLRASSVEAGLGRMIAEWVLARLIATTRAREVKRFHVTTQDLQDGLVVASFLFRHEDLQPILGGLDALTTAVFVDGLDGLFASAPDQDAPDARVELVKF